MKAQLTITVNTGKWLISRAITKIPEVQKAFEKGRIVLKGGTTVSCVSEELIGLKLRISGRITPRGTVGSFKSIEAPHSILIEKGKWENIDECFIEKVLGLEPGDVIIIGANAIDTEGNAAIMAGSPGGGNPGKAIAALTAEGVNTIIAAGLEKLIPGRIPEITRKCGRKVCDFAMGMSVGLIPVYGRIVTEVEALKILGDVEVTVIGKGGINGAEGSTTIVVEGSEESVKKIIKEVSEASNRHLSGNEESLKECKPGSPGCVYHLSCYYSHKNKIKTNFNEVRYFK
ncbi:hypothetical protein THYS13_08430 [Thermoanaerobacter sp. YS13]|uniref:hypothetical protein n=1 Tax=Thermoanaerobacter sp. YS13 TaxID=1511746 RepID=UPI0005753915|nr:hypothetical protein [Thermoanaerobacter sp. YS13]KHO62773.1 hypothetical protein THYS13_08430 [Thermoanaerobacter sp. YS13]